MKDTATLAMAFALRLLLFLSVLILVADARVFDRNLTEVYGFAQGTKFKDELVYASKGISALRVHHDWSVSGLQIAYEFGEWTSPLHGFASSMVTEVTFGYPEEALVQIKGAYGSTSGVEYGITKLTFVTYNYMLRKRATYGPFGGHYKKNQTQFQSPSDNVKQITGFWGYSNSGNGLSALSFYYEPSK